jgi:glycosyltransferase involved in cell wall biosynthesis
VTLSVIIPVYNERDTVEHLVEQVRQANAAGLQKEIIVVDDGSTDGTRALYEKLEGRVSKIILHDRNRGKGAAVRKYALMLEPVLAGKADVVYGSRLMSGRPHRVLLFWHMMGNSFLTLLSNMFTNLNVTDMETCYKLFRRDILNQISLREDRFGFEPEITGKVSAIPGVRIYEVGISYAGRSYGEGKKIGWRDGVRAIYCVVRYSPLGQRVETWLRGLPGASSGQVTRAACWRAGLVLALCLGLGGVFLLRVPTEIRSRIQFVNRERSGLAGTARMKMSLWRQFGRRCQARLGPGKTLTLLADPRSERALA